MSTTFNPIISIYRHHDHEVRVKVEVCVGGGGRAPDDPVEAWVESAVVAEPCAELDNENNPTGKMLFNTGDKVELTKEEEDKAIHEAWELVEIRREEAREYQNEDR